MALDGGYINLFIDIKRSETQKRLIVRWETRNKEVGGNLDLTDLFLSIMEFWGEQSKKCICTQQNMGVSQLQCPIHGSGRPSLDSACPDDVCKHQIGEHD